MICRTCLRELPRDRFYTKHGRPYAQCKDCWGERSRINHQKRKGPQETARKRNYDREYRKRDDYKQRKAAYDRKAAYGITEEEYQDLLARQDGRCAICNLTPTEKMQHHRDSLDTDHDHTTKRVRGLLCSPCNTGLGRFEEDPSLLERAAEYLRAFQDDQQQPTKRKVQTHG